MKKIIFLFCSLVISSTVFAAPLETFFYLTNDKDKPTVSEKVLAQIKKSRQRISVLGPQVYSLKADGSVIGGIDDNLLNVAEKYDIKLMPLIAGFDQESFHRFLTNAAAKQRALNDLVTLCEQNNFYGIQFDFENISVKDKDHFTEFYAAAAKRLHAAGYKISVAVVPRVGLTKSDSFDEWYFDNWSGAYDYASLGKLGDFISVMTYDRHTSLTTPGPVAPVQWVEKVIVGLLKEVPANKISLGIPTYSGYWRQGLIALRGARGELSPYSFRAKENQIGYEEVLSVLADGQYALKWDPAIGSSYAIINRDGKFEYLFAEDARSFASRLDLAKKYKLRGVSVWKLGMEDPAAWTKLG